MSIEVSHVTKRFGAFRALDDVSLEVATGELVALLGPSGSGKTSLLRVIAGIDAPDAGDVLLDGRSAAARGARERRVGFVFQHYALFRHMTVAENVAFGLRVKPRRERPSDEEIARRVRTLLNLVQLDWLGDRLPSQLSGGQRQRVALARALAVEPKVLLLDEPFGSLDARVRQELRRWLRRLHDEIRLTGVFVTHDQEEALEVADRVAVLNHGRIEQVGPPREVWERPASPFVTSFLGNVNLFRGRIADGKAYIGPMAVTVGDEHADAESAMVFVRPHLLDVYARADGENRLRARVRHVNAAGALVKVELLTETGETVFAEISQERSVALQLAAGMDVFVSPREVRVFSEEQLVPGRPAKPTP